MKAIQIIVIVATLSYSAFAETASFGSGDNSFEIEFVTVGDPGNPHFMSLNRQPRYRERMSYDLHIPIGSVDYEYQIGKYEVSLGMFESAIAQGASWPVGELNANIEEIEAIIGIATPDLPAMRVFHHEATAFANWLNESEGFPPAYTADRYWEFGDPGFNPLNPIRNSQAKYFLPTGHEWQKAAYWDEDAKSYRAYSTGELRPTSVFSSNEPSTAVYGLESADGPADIFDAGGESFYGVVGMDGNVAEWEEGLYAIDGRGSSGIAVRGTDWAGDLDPLGSGNRIPFSGPAGGFRIAMVEPHNVIVGDFNGDGAISQADLNLFEVEAVEDAAAKLEAEDIFSGTNHFPWDHANNIMDLDTNFILDQRDLDLWLTLDQSTPGDSDLDGDVDFQDFLVLANNFGVSPSSWSQGDYDGNNESNFLDFLALANYFGSERVADVAAVPEPSSALLGLVATASVLFHRRRRSLLVRSASRPKFSV